MPLAINPIGAVETPEPETPKIYHERYRHSIVDSSFEPEKNILTQVDGIPRLVQWFNPFLGADEEPSPFAPSGAPTYQSYTCIDRVIIHQEGAGAFNFDPETAESDIKFSAYVAFDIVPVKTATFIADIGDGNAGIFAVTEQPEIKNNTANKVYLVTCQYLGILTKEWFEELDSRVVQRLVYNRDSALTGGAATVTTGEFETGKELFQWRGTIANYIMREHYWNPERTINWVTQDKKNVYDPYLVNFIQAVMPPDLRTTYPPINQLSTQYGGREYGSFGDLNIWEVLLRGDFNLLSQCQRDAALIQVSRIQQTRMYGSVRSSKFDLFVATDPKRFLIYSEYYNADGFPILRPSKEEKLTYLFSEGFYTGVPEGEFEHLVFDILKNKMVDHKRLLAYCKTYWDLTPLDKLYNGAILLLLLQVARRMGSPL
jgi:hypothetical protein